MIRKPPYCSTCILGPKEFWCPSPHGFSDLEGDGSSGLMVIAEALGRNEERKGLPLRPDAKAGGVYQKALDVGRLERGVTTITNVIRCRPPGNDLKGMPYERAAIDHCRQYLDQAVAERKPKLLLALGDVPLRELSMVVGTISELRGYVLPSRYGIPMIATYHPSHLARGAFGQLFGVFLHDIRTAYKFALNGVPPKLETHYVTSPTHADIADYLDRLRSDRELPSAYDTETKGIFGVKDESKDDIIQIQFSSGVGEALVLDWTKPEQREGAIEILATENMKWGWNCLHTNTSIWMVDGSWKAIWKVKENDLVRTLLSDGTIGVRRVTASMHKKARGKWLRINVDGGQRRGSSRWKDHGVVCTPDHKWLTTKGWKIAQDLSIGDGVYLPRQGDPDLIHGTALGDGYISPVGRLTLSHTNYLWAKAKANHFGVNLYERTHKNGYSKGTKAYEMGVQVAKEWRQIIYTDDKIKKWSPLSMPALAVLYQDDGWIVKKGYARICLHSFSLRDVHIAKEWAEAHFGKCSLYKYKNGFALAFLSDSSKRLFAEISPFMHPSNYYKLPTQFRGYYNGWMERLVPQHGKVISVEPQLAGARRHSQSEYCVEVEETHNFFTRAGVVANSRLFDLPLLKKLGVKVNGETHDLMNAHLHLQPNFASSKDTGDDEDKGVPARLANLQSCVSFYYPQEGPWKHTVHAPGPGLGGYYGLWESLRYYGARDADLTFRVGVKLFTSLKKLGLW